MFINFDQFSRGGRKKIRLELKSDEALINHLNEESFAHWISRSFNSRGLHSSEERLMIQFDGIQRNENLQSSDFGDSESGSCLRPTSLSKAKDNSIKMSPAGGWERNELMIRRVKVRLRLHLFSVPSHAGSTAFGNLDNKNCFKSRMLHAFELLVKRIWVIHNKCLTWRHRFGKQTQIKIHENVFRVGMSIASRVEWNFPWKWKAKRQSDSLKEVFFIE